MKILLFLKPMQNPISIVKHRHFRRACILPLSTESFLSAISPNPLLTTIYPRLWLRPPLKTPIQQQSNPQRQIRPEPSIKLPIEINVPHNRRAPTQRRNRPPFGNYCPHKSPAGAAAALKNDFIKKPHKTRHRASHTTGLVCSRQCSVRPSPLDARPCQSAGNSIWHGEGTKLARAIVNLGSVILEVAGIPTGRQRIFKLSK